MTLTEFDNGYWYAVELKRFATALGLPSAAKLRKDELERAIRGFLDTGTLEPPTTRRLSRVGVRDVDRGLTLDLPVALYTNDRATKDFLEREAQAIAPGLKRRSGARYRLNRWRERQIAAGVGISYGDLVAEYVRLSLTKQPFQKIPTGRYINFISDHYAAERDATRAEILTAWKALKQLDVPKDYQSWVRARRVGR